MAYETCLWCGNKISDKALTCPKCHTDGPFDLAKKKHAEERDRLEKKRELEKKEEEIAFGVTITCPTCGIQGNIRDVFKKRECPKCGHPHIGPKCSECDDLAIYYDAELKQLKCHKHKVETCCECKRLITDGDKVERSVYHSYSGETYYYHRKCSPEYTQKNKEEFFTFIKVMFILSISVLVVRCMM